jgi:hypothetical protein
MERKTKITIGIISALLIGGGLWFFLGRKKPKLRRKIKKEKAFYFCSIYEYPKATDKIGQIQITVSKDPCVAGARTGSTDAKEGSILAGDEIKIIDTDAILDGKYIVDKVITEKGYVNSLVISTDWDVYGVGEPHKGGRTKYRGFMNKGKIILTKHQK